MFLLPTVVFRSLGAGAILVVIAAVAATLTLVPAMLSLLGDKIDWPRRRKYDAATMAAQQRLRPRDDPRRVLGSHHPDRDGAARSSASSSRWVCSSSLRCPTSI